ncbi:MAG: NADH-quinone oxidoreductase subunit L [Opitutaceae bacterium]
MTIDVENVWLVPALPLVAAAVGASLARESRRAAAGVAIGAMSGALILSVMALGSALAAQADGIAFRFANFAWFDLGARSFDLGWMLDPLGGFMLVMVSFVGLLIFIFSVGYMAGDENFTRFFCFLSLFAGAMLGLLVANSLFLLFIFWEIVGLASYLLIGFWFQRPAAAAAAKKAFITTRIGDLAFLIGILWLHQASGTLLFHDGGRGFLDTEVLARLSMTSVAGGLALSTAVGLLVFCGAIGKSGQFPLHVWLPDAMEGPTPVSALIHAATMVAAGVFLVARVYPLMAADLALEAVRVHALTVVAGIGAITALLGAVIAIAQHDIKRVLAFSTISQLGYMMLAVGVGAWPAAIFHLLMHAFFKALLFLGAGSVIHATHHEQDMRRLGGLAPRMRVTFAAFAVGMMALSGVPFFFSGFWSKEGILHAAEAWEVSKIPLWFALAAAGCTAFYMTRLMAEVFFGRGPRSAELIAHPPRESSRVMTLPLVILAVCAVVLGFLGTPAWPWLQSRLDGSALHFEPGHLLEGMGLMFVSICLVGGGIGLAWWIYGYRARVDARALDPLERAMPGVFAALAGRLGFDELYAATFGRLARAAAWISDALDRWGWGGAVRAVGAMSLFTAFTNRQVDEDAIDAGFDGVSETIRAGGVAYSKSRDGDAHGHLRSIAIGFALLALLLVLGGVR